MAKKINAIEPYIPNKSALGYKKQLNETVVKLNKLATIATDENGGWPNIRFYLDEYYQINVILDERLDVTHGKVNDMVKEVAGYFDILRDEIANIYLEDLAEDYY